MEKLELHGFNNLTKSLCVNMYDVCYAHSAEEQHAYIAYIDEEYNAERLTKILAQCVDIVDARVLNIARQDYEPQGASVAMLVCEDSVSMHEHTTTVLGHLDKSHICVHTYPEMHPEMHPHNGISTFRIDIELSTCGNISPLKSLDFLLESFDADIVNIDYNIRGFTRSTDGSKQWMDHTLTSIQEYIAPAWISQYLCVDHNTEAQRNYHTRMRCTDFDLDRYVFGATHVNEQCTPAERARITARIQQEIAEIFEA